LLFTILFYWDFHTFFFCTGVCLFYKWNDRHEVYVWTHSKWHNYIETKTIAHLMHVSWRINHNILKCWSVFKFRYSFYDRLLITFWMTQCDLNFEEEMKRLITKHVCLMFITPLSKQYRSHLNHKKLLDIVKTRSSNSLDTHQEAKG